MTTPPAPPGHPRRPQPRQLSRRFRFCPVLGFHAVNCPPGPQTAACIAQHAPRVVILDVELGAITGVDVFHQVRAAVTTRQLPFIFFPGSADTLRHELPDYHARGAALVVKHNTAALTVRIHELVHPIA